MDDLESVVRDHGPWTAMAIKLRDGSYTRAPAVDYRLRRLLQVTADVSRKPIDKCRVLDLACLEGHYAIEFALHGAETLGIEGRSASLAKCEFARQNLGLDRARFVQDDVRNLSPEKYGIFDVVICSGILYHLPAADALGLLKAIHRCCSGILILDTFVSLSGREAVDLHGGLRRGHQYGEHDSGETKQQVERKAWASLDNNASFWFTEASLLNMMQATGFTTLLDVLGPAMPGNPRDRKTYLAVKGVPVPVRSSDLTHDAPWAELSEDPNPLVDASQYPRGRAFQAAKRFLPQPLKDAIKPALRAIHVLPPDPTPEFQRKQKGVRDR